jgi:hypothetical protein
LKSFLAGALMKTAPGALLYVFMDWRHLFEMLTAGRALDLRLINICVWNKSNGGMGSLYRSSMCWISPLGETIYANHANARLHPLGRSRAQNYEWTSAKCVDVTFSRFGRVPPAAAGP